jgi:serine-type D-Ala-D-Ala carboxypeptidase/endopeptidase
MNREEADDATGMTLDRAVRAAAARERERPGLLVIGAIDGGATAVASKGPQPRPEVAPERIIFEIGSVTKVFTALLLAIAVERGEATLDDPLVDHLPDGTRVPHRDGAVITLEHLATHSSGLPRLPPGMLWHALRHRDDPYADLSPEDALAALDRTRLRRPPGRRFGYSNFGGGVLGLALAHTAGTSYEALVRDRITGPLGMADTVITLGPEQRHRLAPGTKRRGGRAAAWTLPGLAGAGALHSTVHDLAIFARAQMGHLPPDAPDDLVAAIPVTHRVRTRGGLLSPALRVGLGWMVMPIGRDKVEMLWHNGGTGGYRSFLGWTPVTHTAAICLSSNVRTVDRIGVRVLNTIVRSR